MPDVHAPDRRPSPGARGSGPQGRRRLVQARRLEAAAPDDTPARPADLARPLHPHPCRPPASLASVKKLVASANGTGMDTSEGLLFNHTVWGRDRVITAFDVLATSPEIARQTILTLARLQGVRLRRRSEEEAGQDPQRAPRPGVVGRAAPPEGLLQLHALTVVGRHAARLHDVLRRRLDAAVRPAHLPLRTARPGASCASGSPSRRQPVTVLESLIEAVGWIVRSRHRRGPGRGTQAQPAQPAFANVAGRPHIQLRRRGRMANTADPVAYLDIQMLAMDALRAAALLRAPPAAAALRLRAARGGASTLARERWRQARPPTGLYRGAGARAAGRHTGALLDGRRAVLRLLPRPGRGRPPAAAHGRPVERRLAAPQQPLRRSAAGRSGTLRRRHRAHALRAGHAHRRRHPRPLAALHESSLPQLSRERVAHGHVHDRQGPATAGLSRSWPSSSRCACSTRPTCWAPTTSSSWSTTTAGSSIRP